eukprot:479121-Rhodomonas_salina.1
MPVEPMPCPLKRDRGGRGIGHDLSQLPYHRLLEGSICVGINANTTSNSSYRHSITRGLLGILKANFASKQYHDLASFFIL